MDVRYGVGVSVGVSVLLGVLVFEKKKNENGDPIPHLGWLLWARNSLGWVPARIDLCQQILYTGTLAWATGQSTFGPCAGELYGHTRRPRRLTTLYISRRRDTVISQLC